MWKNEKKVLIIRSLHDQLAPLDSQRSYRPGYLGPHSRVVFNGHGTKVTDFYLKPETTYFYFFIPYDEGVFETPQTFIQTTKALDLEGMIPPTCQGEAAPLFQSKRPLEITLKSDFKTINGAEREKAFAPAEMIWGTSTWDLKLEARGHYRFKSCAMRPLKMIFGQERPPKFQGPFKKLKVVTHCGRRQESDALFQLSDKTFEESLLNELTLYQVLDSMGTLSLKVRPLKIRYVGNDGKEWGTHWAFALEPKKELARRCGFKKAKKGLRVQPKRKESATFFYELLNYFILHFDTWNGHNSFMLLSDLPEAYQVAYDFDLSGIWRTGYRRNHGRSLKQHARIFEKWLGSRFSRPHIPISVDYLRRKIPGMEKVIDESLQEKKGKEHFRQWLNLFGPLLENDLESV